MCKFELKFKFNNKFKFEFTFAFDFEFEFAFPFCRLLFSEICLLIGKSVARFLCSVAHLTPERHTGLVSLAPLCGGCHKTSPGHIEYVN